MTTFRKYNKYTTTLPIIIQRVEENKCSINIMNEQNIFGVHAH